MFSIARHLNIVSKYVLLFIVGYNVLTTFSVWFFLFSFLIELIQSKATNNARNSTKNMYSNSKIIVVNDMQFIPSYYLSTDWL